MFPAFTEKEKERLLAFKRQMHRHPELSHEEYSTTALIRSFIETIPGTVLLELPSETGCLAAIRGKLPGKEVGLRADIDAIRQNETYDSPWKSVNEGVMHACGHDFHTAALLGAAILLSKMTDRLPGAVDLLFQPAEETTDGMKALLDAGLLDIIHPEMFFSEHNRPEVPVGKIVVNSGALMAAKTNLRICISGRGGHGSTPHLGADPIVCAAAVIQGLQTIVSRNTDPLDSAVVSVNYIHGGSIQNLVVTEAVLNVTVRALKRETMDRCRKRLAEIVMMTAGAFECGAAITVEEDIPPVFHTGAMAGLAFEAAAHVVGPENVICTQPSLASEDFSFMMERVPSFYYWTGSGMAGEESRAWHQPDFHTDDRAIFTAAEVLARSAVYGLRSVLKTDPGCYTKKLV